MIVSRFRSVGWVAGVAVAALGCYLVSQRVSTERVELARVERSIIAARRDIRQLEVELQTRSRLTQLDRWNADVLALSAPRASQFLDSDVRLASLGQPAPLPLDPAVTGDRPAIRLASAEAPARTPDRGATDLIAPAEPSLLRHATYVKPADAGDGVRATRVALLDDALLGDIGRLAAAEQGTLSGKQGR